MLAIKTEFSRALRARSEARGEDVRTMEQRIGPALAGALGPAIRQRVSLTGNLAGQSFPGWDEWRKPKMVSAKYPDGGLRMSGPKREHRSGAIYYRDSRTYHEFINAKRGAYMVSGGMWGGLSRVLWSPRLTTLSFRGRSDGQDPRIINGKSRPLKVNNAFKAWTVFAKHDINVLALTEREFNALLTGSISSLVYSLDNSLPIDWRGLVARGGTPELAFASALGSHPPVQTAAPVG